MASYVTEFYGRKKNFVDILIDHAGCFVLEDSTWLRSLVKSHQKEEDFVLDLQVEGREMAIHLKASGFCVGQGACVLEDI